MRPLFVIDLAISRRPKDLDSGFRIMGEDVPGIDFLIPELPQALENIVNY